MKSVALGFTFFDLYLLIDRFSPFRISDIKQR